MDDHDITVCWILAAPRWNAQPRVGNESHISPLQVRGGSRDEHINSAHFVTIPGILCRVIF